MAPNVGTLYLIKIICKLIKSNLSSLTEVDPQDDPQNELQNNEANTSQAPNQDQADNFDQIDTNV